MKRESQFRKYVRVVLLSLIGLLFMTGCTGYQIESLGTELSEVQGKVASVADAIGKQTYGPDETLNLLKALQAGNVASTPFNPYALPVGIGLSGIIAMLEALRRKEKGGRKYAEQEIKNGNSNNGKRSKGKT